MSAKWVANYKYSGRPVENHATATIVVSRETGLFVRHRDDFDLWTWASMALGWAGWLLGWNGLFQGQIKAQARASLDKFMARERK